MLITRQIKLFRRLSLRLSRGASERGLKGRLTFDEKHTLMWNPALGAAFWQTDSTRG